jgi:hemerythrin-like domain-containing protein
MGTGTQTTVLGPYTVLAREHRLSEHELGRERVGSMAAAVERSSRGDPAAGKVFMRYARSYIHHLRSHIAKEDECLASAVAVAFSSDERERLTHEFEEMERREIGERAFERCAAVVETLEARHSEGSSTDPNVKVGPPSGPETT